MLKQYSVPEAQKTILKRIPLNDVTVPPAVLERTAALFGEPLSPYQAVERILADVRRDGDAALRNWTVKLDGAAPDSLRVPPEELRAALDAMPSAQRKAFELAAERVLRFHQAQPVTSWMTQSLGGTLGQYIRPIRRIGLYVPGGTAPLPSSLLMSVCPAQAAGVKEIAIATPPQNGVGRIAPSILAVAALLGIDEVYAIGGAQAIGALAYGTETVQSVDKIFGPGNLFVTLAKKQVFGVVGIDGLAGPTETMVIADETANPEWVAADLLAQAEHDLLASAILLCPSQAMIQAVQAEVTRQFAQRSRKEMITSALNERSGAVLTRDLEEALDLANAYAPEHLCVATREPFRLAERVTCAGGVFVGEHSFEVLGDYVAGPSHVMPTGGTARFASPLNVLDFVHVVSLVSLDPATAQAIAPAAVELATLEGLDAHANSAQVRL